MIPICFRSPQTITSHGDGRFVNVVLKNMLNIDRKLDSEYFICFLIRLMRIYELNHMDNLYIELQRDSDAHRI